MPDGRCGRREEQAAGAGRRSRYGPAVTGSKRGIFAKQLGVLPAKLLIEPLGLLRAFQQATEAAAVAMKEFTHPHEGGDGLAILTGIHEAEGGRENTFLTFRRR
jgi:hypothetical protein